MKTGEGNQGIHDLLPIAYISTDEYMVWREDELKGRRREQLTVTYIALQKHRLPTQETYRLAIGYKHYTLTYCNYRGQASIPG